MEEDSGDQVKVDGGIRYANDGQDKVTLAIKGWPTSPSTMNKWSSIVALEISLYILMAIGAVIFLIFALLAASVDRTFPRTHFKYSTGGPILLGWPFFSPSYPNGTEPQLYLGSQSSLLRNTTLNANLFEAAKLGPTIFPILFAGAVGSFLRLLARKRAEQGSTMEFLEALLGSRSLPSTISTVFSLGHISLVEIGLIFLWMLSPIGGQASLRMLNIQNITGITSNFPWIAVNPSTLTIIDQEDSLEIKTRFISTFTSISFLYDGLMSGLETGTLNLVGFEIQGPIALHPDIGPMTLSALGISVSYNANMSFTVSYSQFRCPSVSQDLVNGSWTSMLGSDFIYANFSGLLQKSKYGSGFFVDTNDTFQSEIDGHQNFLFGSFYNSKVTLWSCLLYSNTRNITFGCNDPGDVQTSLPFFCGVRSVGVATLSDVTPFNNYNLAASLYGEWPAIDSASTGVSSFTERYIAYGGIYGAFNLETDSGPLVQPSLVDLSIIDNVTFANRLTTIFNTYIQTTQTKTTQAGILDLNQVQYSTYSTPLLWLPFDIVDCNWIYFTILTLASVILLICSLSSIWLRFRITTPDILGYVSSSTIESPFVSISDIQPGSGSMLSGLQRAKLLGKMKVQLRDVQENEEFGKFALTNQVRNVSSGKKDRMYV
ncbi:hypothetical protein L207DRAFT_591891 [Hyaloscypha variabilis F]|uniref:Uncharacterized protein n=1 Tax=Hyaloscypha variabilis (strain UAMH 11265 / GT02V1 / F) TaxID=1149755 RepID=A0A2J6QXE8_HYAVF|nr:hypothetical protein L207DRAFT_591891 [Hyaloscypha variabilis F]